MTTENTSIQNIEKLIKVVNSDIQKFHTKSSGEPEWMDISDIEDNVTDENVLDFIEASFGIRNPPLNGTAKDMLEYYQHVNKTLSQFKIDPEHISFDFSGKDISISMFVTPANKMTPEDYYKKIVWHKGQLISLRNENERKLDQVNQVHHNYVKDVDEETLKKLNVIHVTKTEHFKVIDQLLSKAIVDVTQEELKYKSYQHKPVTMKRKK